MLLAVSVKATAQDVENLYQRGADAFSDGLFTNAAETFRALVERYPDSSLRSDASFLLALAYYHLGDYVESYDLLGAFARLFPDSEHIAVLGHWQAAVRLAQGRATEAVVRIKRQLERTDAPLDYRWRSLLLHAIALEQTGRHREAELAYLAMVDDLPDTEKTEALFRAGQLAYQDGRFAEAAQIFKMIWFNHAGSSRAAQAMFAEADSSLMSGQHSESAERFSQYLEQFPEGDLAELARARLPFLYLTMEEFLSAALAVDASLRDDPARDLEGRLLQVKGEALLQLGDTEGALLAMSAALDASLDVAVIQRAHYHMALVYREIGQRELELKSLQEAAYGPDSNLASSSILNRGYMLIQAGDLEAGAEALQHLVDDYPNHPEVAEALQVLARTREALEDTSAANVIWDRLWMVMKAGDCTTATMASSSMAGLLRAADAAAAVHEDERALWRLACLRRLGSGADSLEAIYRIGRIYGSRGEHMRAAQFYREVVEAEPRGELNWRARLALGAELFNAGKYEEALIYLRDGNESVWEPYRNLALGRVHYRLRQSDEANVALAVAAQAPDAAVASDASYLYAAAHYQGGRYQEAYNAYLDFIDRYPDDEDVPSAFYRAALSQIRLDQPDPARELLTTALLTIEAREVHSSPVNPLESGYGVALAQEILYVIFERELLAGQVDDAKAALEKLRLRAPTGLMATEAGLYYGKHLVAHGQEEAGLKSLQRVLLDAGENEIGRRALAAAAEAAEAIGQYEQAADFHWRTLLATHDRGLRERALAGLRTSFDRIGLANSERYFLAAAVSEEGFPRDVRARVMYDYAMLIHPYQPDVGVSILKEALRDLEAGEERDDGYFLLAESYQKADELQRAIGAYRAVSEVAVADGGRQAEAHLRWALILQETEGEQAAANELTDVALRFPDQIEIATEALYHAAVLLRDGGSIRSAERLRTRMLKRYPDSLWTKQLQKEQEALSKG